MFRIRIFSCFICLSLIIQGLWGLSSQELSKVTINNETGKTLKYLFTSPSDSNVWGPDLLGARALKYGGVGSYYIHYPGTKARFDLLALDTQNDAYLIQALLLTEGQDTVVKIGRIHYIGPYRNLKISHVYVTNVSKHSFSYLFFSPEESEAWGFDILTDTSTLEPGESISFSVPVGKKSQRYEILALSREQAIVQRQVVLSENVPQIYIDFTISDLH